MGNAQSDSGEESAFQIIRHIPLVNLGYGAVRTIVYASKGDPTRAVASVTETISGTVPFIAGGIANASAGFFTTASEILKMASPGDVLEFNYGWYGHYALYLGDGKVMDVPGDTSSGKAWICVKKLENVQMSGGGIRISNHDDIAHKHFDGRKPRSESDILRHARSYEGREVQYQFTERNCEYYCTLWRFGKGFSTQVARLSKTPNGAITEDIGALLPVYGLAFGIQEVAIMAKYKAISE